MKKGMWLLLLFWAGAVLGNSEGVKKLVSSNNDTGVALYKKLMNKEGNIVISPFSIGSAMSMTLAGAEGDTRKEMAGVMQQSLNDSKMGTAFSGLNRELEKVSNGKSVVFENANALAIIGGPVSPKYKDIIKSIYGGVLFSNAGVKEINAWVKKKTDNKIPEILEKLNPNSVCVLLNAVYFKGEWDAKFDKKRTLNLPFHCQGGKKIRVPMMRQQAKFKVVKRSDYQVLALPFKGEKVEFFIILPSERVALNKIEENINGKEIKSLISDFKGARPGKITLLLPRFKLEYDANLIPSFKDLGMKKAFSSKFADFGVISGGKNALGKLWITQIQHKACFEIDEEGGTGAASTAVEIATKSAFRKQYFRVDRPFMFLIVDLNTDSILFMGRIQNPGPNQQ